MKNISQTSPIKAGLADAQQLLAQLKNVKDNDSKKQRFIDKDLKKAVYCVQDAIAHLQTTLIKRKTIDENE